MANKYKLDIFEVLRKADLQDYEWFDNLSDDEKKEFKPWLVQRWLSSKKLNLVNEITNPMIGNLPPEMCWRLFCAIGIKGTSGYKFPVAGKNSSKQSNILLDLVTSHYQVSTKVALGYIPLLTKENFMELATLEGIDDPEIKKLKVYLKKHYG